MAGIYATEEGGLAPVATEAKPDAVLLAESLEVVKPQADQLIAMFYHRLFEDYPEVREMFPSDLTAQRERLLSAIVALVTHFEHPADLLPALSAMGRRHAGYGVTLWHYAIVGDTLLGALAEFAGPAWTPYLHGAWARAYTFAAGTMAAAGSGALDPVPA